MLGTNHDNNFNHVKHLCYIDAQRCTMQTGRVRERWMLLVAAMVGVWLSSSDRTVLGAVDGRSTRVQLDREADLILSLSCDDRPRADGAHEASAFTIVVDDSAVQEMLVFPGSGKRQYDA